MISGGENDVGSDSDYLIISVGKYNIMIDVDMDESVNIMQALVDDHRRREYQNYLYLLQKFCEIDFIYEHPSFSMPEAERPFSDIIRPPLCLGKFLPHIMNRKIIYSKSGFVARNGKRLKGKR